MIQLIKKIIEEALRYDKASLKDTEAFKALKHNKDLCTRVEEQIDNALAPINKYHYASYDIQGLKDEGTDIVIRLNDEEKGSQYICFQIKSFDDLESEGYLMKIKAQAHDSYNKYGIDLHHYYLLLCTDEVLHKEKIRSINASFVSTPNSTVIDPRESLSFLKTNVSTFVKIVDHIAREGDFVYNAAISLLNEFSACQRAILFAMIQIYMTGSIEKLTAINLYDHYFLDDFKNTHEFNFSFDFAALSRHYTEWAKNDTLDLDVESLKPITALILDSAVRYSTRTDVAVSHVWSLLEMDLTDLEEESYEEEESYDDEYDDEE